MNALSSGVVPGEEKAFTWILPNLILRRRPDRPGYIGLNIKIQCQNLFQAWNFFDWIFENFAEFRFV